MYRLPDWLKTKRYDSEPVTNMLALLRRLNLNTVCTSCRCPNIYECFSQQTATFLILGNVCTRGCNFCAIEHGKPQPVNPHEPERILQAVETLGLKYVVITSVTRDDLPDGGASHFAKTIDMLKNKIPGIPVEVLVPDFKGNKKALATVAAARPDVIAHNIETIPRLYARVRPGGDYHRSLSLLETVKYFDSAIITKSGLMVGMGENENEILAVLKDLRTAGCQILTIGQYLPPSVSHFPLYDYVTPKAFDRFKELAANEGFLAVASKPLCRSSYKAGQLYRQTLGYQ